MLDCYRLERQICQVISKVFVALNLKLGSSVCTFKVKYMSIFKRLRIV